MKKYNINNYVYIQITQEGWDHLQSTVTQGFINNCIKSYKVTIDGEEWYKLQLHQVMDLFPIKSKVLFKPTILLEDED